MAEYLLVSDAAAPVAESETATYAAGLARALLGSKHRVTIVTLGPPSRVAAVPSMARRLRTVPVRIGSKEVDLPLFESRSSDSQVQLYVLGTEAHNRGLAGEVLASGSSALIRDGLAAPDVVIGWGETSAAALAVLPARMRLFVLPTGSPGAPLLPEEREMLGTEQAMDALSATWMVAWGATSANAVVVPSPTAASILDQHPALAARASDQPIVPIRFGCDDPPFDPASDPALSANYTPDALAGKAECRRTLVRAVGLATGPRTLIVATPGLFARAGGQTLLDALPRLVQHDVAVVISATGERALLDRANVLCIEHPGKIVVAPAGVTVDRGLLAGADALLLVNSSDAVGRLAGLAMRYGTLPLAAHAGAAADYLVDYDPVSSSGSALLFTPDDLFEIEGTVRRAAALHANSDSWAPLVRSLMLAGPRWATTVSQLEAVVETGAAERAVSAG